MELWTLQPFSMFSTADPGNFVRVVVVVWGGVGLGVQGHMTRKKL